MSTHALRSLFVGLLVGVVTVCSAGVTLAQPRAFPAPAGPGTDVAQIAQQLTLDLVRLNVQYNVAPPERRGRLEADLLQAADSRQQALLGLVETDPGAVLRLALPAHMGASLPANVQGFLEEDLNVEGELEVLCEEGPTGARYDYHLNTVTHGRLALHFASDAPELLTGSWVRVQGVRVEQTLALSSGSTSVQALVTVAPNTFGEQRTLVILVNFQDKVVEPYTVEQARSVVFSTTSNWDMENFYGQTWLTGDVVGWFTIPQSSTVCDTATLATYAKQAATAAGVPVSNYRRFVYGFPTNACNWWGLGTVGGNPSQAWIRGSFVLDVVGHEMGHNFGLYHSHSQDCGAAVYGGTCTTSEYGDTLDIMGASGLAHTNAFQKERLGWLNYGVSPPLQTVTTSGTYTLAPYEQPGPAPKALKILRSVDATTGQQSFYYLEYRQPSGFDGSFSSNTNARNGVVLHAATANSGNTSMLLDLTPETSSWQDPALDVGWTYTDVDAGVTITPVWADATGTGVSVVLGPQTCVRGTPLVAFSPAASPWLSAGTTTSYTVSVTNRDNIACAPSDFTVAAGGPGGWSVSPSTAVLTVSPGTAASTSVTVISPSSATDGFYTITGAVSDAGESSHVASASATYVVVSSLSVSTSLDKASYSPGDAVKISTSVRADGAAVSGASLSVLVKRPDGSTTKLGATTGSNGTATVTFRTKKQDLRGTYVVTTTATAGGITGQAVSTFALR